MTPPIRPEATTNPRLARIREVIRGYAVQGADAEDIRELITQHHPELLVTPAQELAAMPRTALEEARGAGQSLMQGATFNFGDEIVAGIRAATSREETYPEALADERASLAAFREANPRAAFGLEVAGGVASGVGGARTAARVAPRLVTQAAANPLKTAAAAGAVAGAGAGEDATGRAGLAVAGGLLAPLVTAGAQRFATSRTADLLREGWDNLTAANPSLPVALRTPSTTAAPGAAARATTATAAPDAPVPVAVPVLPAGTPTPGTAVVRTRTAVAPASTPPRAVAPAVVPGSDEARAAAEEALATGRLRSTPGRRMAARAILGEQGERAGEVRRQLQQWDDLGMADDVTLMTAGGRPSAEAARNIANMPRSAAAETMDAVLARQGSRLGVRVGQDIAETTGQGAVPGPIRLRAMQDELERRTGAAFAAFRARGDVGALDLDEAAAQQFARYVAAVQRNNPALSARPATDAEVVDAAFKLLQEEVRAKGRGASAVAARGVRNLRDRVLGAIEQVDPEYAMVVRQYALDEDVGKVAQEAYTRGTALPVTGTPVGTFTAETAGKPAFIADAMRTGASARLVADAVDAAPNIDLGKLAKFRNVAEGVMGRQGQAIRFREIFGEDAYRRLMARLSPKIQAAALNAIVRGNSTTARQLLAAQDLTDQAVLDIIEQTARQGPVAAGADWAIRNVMRPARGLVTGEIGAAATEAAQLLGTRGAKRGARVVDVLEAIGRQDAARRKAARATAGAVARTGVNQ